MRIRTPADLGALIRDHRIKLRLDQKALAAKVGVSRQWLVEVEKGKPRAEIGLLLRTLGALGVILDAEKEDLRKQQDKTRSRGVEAYVDIDSIVASARRNDNLRIGSEARIEIVARKSNGDSVDKI